jgi:hypothetical protein
VRARRHQHALDAIFLRAAAPARIQLAADPHSVGGRIGVLCVRHTWTRTLAYPPHGHWLVPAGGVSADRPAWRPARPSSLGPVHALAKLFRGRLQALGRPERPDLSIPEAGWTTGGVVSGQPALQGPELVLNYRGRYVPRIALTNTRILSTEDAQGRFRDQDAQDQRGKMMT